MLTREELETALRAIVNGGWKSRLFFNVYFTEVTGTISAVNPTKEAQKKTVFEYISAAANSGNGNAISYLGILYEVGRGVQKDINRAVELYRTAIDQHDNSFGHNDLGRCYELGIGVPKDISQAVAAYLKAATKGNPLAQFNLARCYEYGLGVTEDITQAAESYRKSAEQGYNRAQWAIGWCYEFGKGVRKDMKKAAEWYIKSAEQGYSRGQYDIGRCYKNGIGVRKDLIKSAEWYMKSAEQGYISALSALSLPYKPKHNIEIVQHHLYSNVPDKVGALLASTYSSYTLIAHYRGQEYMTERANLATETSARFYNVHSCSERSANYLLCCPCALLENDILTTEEKRDEVWNTYKNNLLERADAEADKRIAAGREQLAQEQQRTQELEEKKEQQEQQRMVQMAALIRNATQPAPIVAPAVSNGNFSPEQMQMIQSLMDQSARNALVSAGINPPQSPAQNRNTAAFFQASPVFAPVPILPNQPFTVDTPRRAGQ